MSEPSSSDCLFCRIVAGSIPAEVVGESEHSLAFRDVDPQAPTHVLVVPRRHVANAAELADASADELADVVRLAGRVAAQEGLAQGYRVVVQHRRRGGPDRLPRAPPRARWPRPRVAPRLTGGFPGARCPRGLVDSSHDE